MKKRSIIIIVIALLAMRSSMGQIVLTEEDVGINQRLNTNPGTFGVMAPLQNSDLDQWKDEYVPLGDGLLLLVGLGGAYLLRKRNTRK